MGTNQNNTRTLDSYDSGEFVTPADLARITGLSPSFFAMRRQRGQQPAYSKLGRAVRYKISDIRDFIFQHNGGGA